MTEIKMIQIAPEKWLELNAKLQQKKRSLREELSQRGVLKREGNNSFDHYKYFSEAQYKELFTELLSKHGLEMSFDEIAYETYTAEGKQPNGRMPKLRFYLHDTETGFHEATTITGEGLDKGDKAGYKAYTGALKYFLANTFMVATGDDPETESPESKGSRRQPEHPLNDPKITSEQAEQLKAFAEDVGITVEQICKTFRIKSLKDMTQRMRVKATDMLVNEQKKRGAQA